MIRKKIFNDFRERLGIILNSKLVDRILIFLAAIYLLLVIAQTVIDSLTCYNSDLIGLNNNLEIMELILVFSFFIEIILKVIAFGISVSHHYSFIHYLKVYFKDCWYCVDAIIICFTLSLLLLDLNYVNASITEITKMRGVFRLFRIMLLTAKAKDFTKKKRKLANIRGFDVKSPVEKILELLSNFEDQTKDSKVKLEINWYFYFSESCLKSNLKGY